MFGHTNKKLVCLGCDCPLVDERMDFVESHVLVYDVLGLASNTFDERIRTIGYVMAQIDSLGQPTHHARLDCLETHADGQGRGSPSSYPVVQDKACRIQG